MRRFFIDKTDITENTAVITGNDAKHISRVLRLSPGTIIELLDGSGNFYHAEITQSSPRETRAVIKNTIVGGNESPVRINVAQAYLKEKKMDTLVRHLTELGITSWFPYQAHRSVPSPDTRKIKAKMERWGKITREAMKQCERSKLPEIGMHLSFKEMISQANSSSLKIMFHERETQKLDLKNLPSLPAGSEILVVFGPEGGFTDEETDLLKEEGFVSISLGPRILRAETATIAGVTMVQHLFGDMS